MTNKDRILQLALKGLEAERENIDAEIRSLLKQVRGDATQPKQLSSKGANRLSAVGRRNISSAMKKRWAEYRQNTSKRAGKKA